MTAKDLALYGLESSGYQIEKVFEGIPDADWERALTSDGMTPRQMLEHLCECYTAYLKHAKGEQHNWGTYKAPDNSVEGLRAEQRKLRAECKAIVEGSHDPDALTSAMDYLVLHDPYHVGQMALLRLQIDPNWNAYSIYKSE